ncbi:MAG: hypothetical protein HOO88_08550 [Kiritimatiellaceae bacterium]|nr:hypothetical protein [Kiritimatiellaceae bacterium]
MKNEPCPPIDESTTPLRGMNRLAVSHWFVALFCGIILSTGIAREIVRQGRPNLNWAAEIKEAEQQGALMAKRSPEQVSVVGEKLSAYNRNIANCRLLAEFSQDEQNKIIDPVLKELIGKSAKYEKSKFAFKEYGTVTALFIGAFSVVLTASVSWLLLWPLVQLVRVKF